MGSMATENEIQLLLSKRDDLIDATQSLEEDYRSGRVSKLDYKVVRDSYDRKLKEVEKKLGVPKVEAMREKKRRFAPPRERKAKPRRLAVPHIGFWPIYSLLFVIVVAGVAYYFLTSGGLPILLYPSAEDTGHRFSPSCIEGTLPEGWSWSVIYEAHAGVSDVMEWYKTKLSGEGWTKVNENMGLVPGGENIRWGRLLFSKGDLGVDIQIHEYPLDHPGFPGENHLVITWGPKPEWWEYYEK